MSVITTLKLGFIPLVDAAPLIVAEEMGFAAEEGPALDLVRAPSWSALRDQLSFGRVDAAHMLSPVRWRPHWGWAAAWRLRRSRC
jgi:NitT/TauT family transport system ATP-binding protein